MTSRGKQPPKWIRSFLSHFLDDRLLEGSLGDLEEKYSNNVENGMPVWRANLGYIVEALGFIRLASSKKEESSSGLGHFIHVLIFFTRLVRKDKSYYLVSIFGLALSLASFLLITMYVVDELSFDKIHENQDRIVRVTTHVKVSDVDFDLATTQFPAAHALRSEFPEIEEALRLYTASRELSVDDKKFKERVVFADDNFFKVFSFPLLHGDKDAVLDQPGNVVLTRSASIRYFGSENSVGKEIKINQSTSHVAGVMDDVDKHSHLRFEVLLPLSNQLNEWKAESGFEGRENKWFWIGAYTYLLLSEPGDETKLIDKIPVFVKKYFPERFQNSWYEFQKLGEIHLTSHKDNELEPNGDILYVRLFSTLAIVIMVVSTINVINLSYFKLSGRTREINIRKFLGQNSARVVSQLFIESCLAGIVSFGIALLFCRLLLGGFNLIVDKDLSLRWDIIGATFLLVILISVVAIAGRTSVRRFRNSLIGLQVGASFVLLVFSFIVSGQIDFFKSKDLGFDKSNVVVIDVSEEFDHEALKIELKKNSSVIDVTQGEEPGRSYNGWRFVPEGGSYEKPVMLPFTFSDENFLQTMKIKLLAGRNFTKALANDSLWPFLINKRAAIELGWADDAIGRRLEVFQPGRTEIMAKGEVIGIIDDYHAESLHDAVKPVVITTPTWGGNIIVRVTKVNGETISAIESVWKEFSKKPFRYTILDQQLEKLYANEQKLSNVMLFFTFIALYLTCYGMFAMSSLLFSSKLKEVAIRKVLGAGEISIMSKFYGKYALFNVVALAIGLPVAIWLGNLWLETFPYRIDLSLMFFLKAASLILGAGILSVSYYLAKVTFTNPLPFLRQD